MKRTLWHNLRVCPAGDPNHTINDAAIAVENGEIARLGAHADLPGDMSEG